MTRAYLLLLLCLQPLLAHTVSDYRPIGPVCHGTSVVIRQFRLDGTPMRLVVDSRTLRTRIEPPSSRPRTPCPDSRYFRLLRAASAAPWPLQNDGLTRGRNGLYLTTDLCPSSKKGYEERLYRTLIQKFAHPVPVTLFVTQRWIERHETAFDRLKRWDREGKLAILWGNHTARHHYHPGVPLQRNFVLSAEENLDADILDLERFLIERGVTPSVFFRFPGLVSDRHAVETVRRLGLIVLGSDAWLAKGRHPRRGSIILVHGNGNEPGGVDRFLRLVKEKKISALRPLLTIELPTREREERP